MKLFLEKDGETQDFEFDLSTTGAMKAVKKIKQLNKEKWRLVYVDGDNPVVVGYFKKLIQSYETDPKSFKPSAMDVVKMGVSIVKGDKKKIDEEKR